MTLPRPTGVLFDFGDTLLREGPIDLHAGAAAVLQHAEPPTRYTAEELAIAMAQLMADLDPRRQSSHLELPVHTTWCLLYEPRGIRFSLPPAELEWVFWNAATTWSLEPGAREVLSFIRDTSMPCGVVSNTMFRGQTVARQLAVSGLDGLVPWVITSAEHVVRKPHPRLFALAAQRLGSAPETTWFLGDSLECDINGAAAAGMVPIWYTPARAPVERYAPARGAVSSWGEFQQVLQATLAGGKRAT